MPVIPQMNEAQVMNAGSPVPIAGSGDARLQGQANAQLGQAMFAYGDALDSAAAQLKNRQKKLDLETLDSMFRLDNAEKQARTKAAASGKDPFANVKTYTEESLKARDKFAEMSSDPEVRQEFLARANKHVADNYVPLYSGEVVKFEELQSAQATNLINLKKDLAEKDPGTIQESFVALEETFKAMGIREDKAVEGTLKGKKQIAEAAVQGALIRKQYKLAEQISTDNAELYSEDERKKSYENIRETFWKNTTQKHTTDEWAKKEQEEFKESRREAWALDTLALLSNAQTEAERRLIREKEITGAVIAGKASEKWVDFVDKIATKQMTKIDDSVVVMEIFDRVGSNKMTVSQAKKAVIDLATGPDAKLSYDKAETLWKFFKQAEDRQKNSPLYMKQVNEAVSYIKTYNEPQGVAEKMLMGIWGDGPRAQQKQEAVQNFLRKELSNPGNIKTHRDQSLRGAFGDAATLPAIFGVEYNEMDPDPVIKQKTLDAAAGKTPSEKKRLFDQAQKFMDKRKEKAERDARVKESRPKNDGTKEYE